MEGTDLMNTPRNAITMAIVLFLMETDLELRDLTETLIGLGISSLKETCVTNEERVEKLQKLAAKLDMPFTPEEVALVERLVAQGGQDANA